MKARAIDEEEVKEYVDMIINGEISQKEVAEITGTHRSTVSEWVKRYGSEKRFGRFLPDISNIPVPEEYQWKN